MPTLPAPTLCENPDDPSDWTFGEGGTCPAGYVPVPAPPIPHVGNPVPYIVHGAEAAWSDVSSWVSDRWHSITSFFTGGFTMGWDEVKSLVDVALSAEQTAWASFVNTLEAWISASIGALEAAISDVGNFAMELQATLLGDLVVAMDAVLRQLLDSVYGIDQALARQWWDTVQAIDNMEANLRTWAIDNVYDPLLQDVWNVIALEQADIANLGKWLQTQIDGIDQIDIPAILTRLGIIAAAITALQTWVDDCGEPMCAQMGPKTDWSKLLKVLNVAGMLALLTSVGSLTESELEQLAATVASMAADPAAAFAQAFVTDGDTLAAAIASNLPQIAI